MSPAGSMINYVGSSAAIEFRLNSNPVMVKVSVLTTVLLLSLLFKLALLYDSYYNGFLITNLDIMNPDEYTYLADGRALSFLGEKYGFGSNWLYVYLNYFAFTFISDIDAVFLLLCAFNMSLSFCSPFLLLPVIRDSFKDRAQYERAALIFLTLALLWPQGAYLTAHNLKDTLLQFLVSAYVLVFHSFMKEIDGQGLRKARVGGYLFAAAGLVFLIFSLRSYLAAMLFAISFFPVLVRKPGVALVALAMVSATIAAYPDPFVYFVQNNFLFSADAAKDLADATYAAGGGGVRINQDPIGIATSALRFFLGPVPSTPLDVYQFLGILQSAVVYFLAYFWIKGVRNVPSDFRGFTLWLFLSIGLFYGVAELFSGARQRYPVFDHIYLVSAAVGMAEMKMSDVTKAMGVAVLIYLVGRYIAISTY